MAACFLCNKIFVPKDHKRAVNSEVLQRLENLDFHCKQHENLKTPKICRKCFDNISQLEKAQRIRTLWSSNSAGVKRKRISDHSENSKVSLKIYVSLCFDHLFNCYINLTLERRRSESCSERYVSKHDTVLVEECYYLRTASRPFSSFLFRLVKPNLHWKRHVNRSFHL